MIDPHRLAPSRRVEKTEHGYIVFVKPPDFLGYPEVSVFLTPDQFGRYEQWQRKELLIQEALPELSDSEREMLMSGLSDEDFDDISAGLP